MKHPGGPRRNDYTSLALASTAVAELVAPVLIGVWLDRRFGWSPWGLVVGATVGFVGGLAHLLYLARRAEQK